MINIYDLSKKKTAVLQQSYEITETIKLNDISELTFSLPADDEKADKCKARHYVRDDDAGEMYRIIDYEADVEDTSQIAFTCEHVIATLADTLMFGDTVATGSTANVIKSILARQSNWVLGECDFNFYYEYAWTSENLLVALFSIPKPFTEAYQWVFDTSSFPWVLSLKRLDLNSTPQFYVFAGLNFLRSQKKTQTGEIFTKLYAQGYGEGVNQLGIESVNDGLPYILADEQAISDYGIIEGHYVDRSIEDASTLLQRAKAILAETQSPTVEYDVSAADLYELTKNEYQRAAVGKIIEFTEDNYRTYITEVKKNHDEPGDLSLKLATKPTDLANLIADIADRQRIESTYSQGATQLWSNTTADNASPTNGHEHAIWIPDDALIINKVMVRIKLDRFRTYSKATKSGGGSTRTSSSGGSSTVTSSAGGSGSVTSGDGGSTATSSGGGGKVTSSTNTSQYNTNDVGITGKTEEKNSYTHASTGKTNSHSHDYLQPTSHYHIVDLGSHHHQMFHSHTVEIPEHTHSINIGSHSHSVSIPSHSHSVSVPQHSHTVDIPDHTHEIEYGIFNASEVPTSAMVYVGDTYAFSMETSFEGDITKYLIGEDGKIPRGKFIELLVVPDTLARVTVSSAPQAFIQSKSGGTY